MFFYVQTQVTKDSLMPCRVIEVALPFVYWVRLANCPDHTLIQDSGEAVVDFINLLFQIKLLVLWGKTANL